MAAAQALKTANPESVINAIFLGYKGGTANNPQGTLQEITGAPERVKLVPNASEVVEKIKDLKLPTTLKRSNTEAALTVDGKAGAALAITSFKKTTKGRYLYITDIFTPTGKKDTPVINSVTISVKTASGDILKSTTDIEFTLKE